MERMKIKYAQITAIFVVREGDCAFEVEVVIISPPLRVIRLGRFGDVVGDDGDNRQDDEYDNIEC